MTTDRTIRTRLLATTMFCGLALAAPAFAQSTGPGATGQAVGDATKTANQANGAENQGDLIVVTGSRIAQPQLTSATPLTVVGAAEIRNTGTSRIEDLVNSLPQVFAGQSANLSNGANGTATVNLRGLGTTRTLVLVNGKRLVPGDPSAPVADLNFIPAFLVQRIDVLTGGASSTYGSDAVAGVVNFVMDTNFEGFKIDGQYSFDQHNNAGDSRALAANQARGFSPPAGNTVDGQGYQINAAIGVKTPDGRGHATVYAGYRTQYAVLQNQRDFSNCALNEDGAGGFVCGGSGTTAPARFRPNGAGPLTFRNFGVPVPGLSFPVATDPNGLPIDPTTGQVFINPATAGTDKFGNIIPARSYQLGDVVPKFDLNPTITNAAGAVVPNPNFNRLLLNSSGTAAVPFRNSVRRIFDRSLNNGSLRPYNGDTDAFNYAPYNYYQRPDERFTLGGFAEYEVADYFKPYLEAMFMDDQTNAVIAPSGIFNQNINVNCNNPLLSAQEVQTICTNYGYGPNDSAPTVIGRRNIEGGGRDSDLTHISYRIVVGAKGDIGAGFSYDVYAQYGRTRQTQIYFNDFSVNRIKNSLQVVNVNGVPTCKSVIDGTDPNCVPYNIFGGTTTVQPTTGQGVTQAALNYLQTPGFQVGSTTEQVVSGSITGDLGRFGLKSPFADNGVGVAVGGEWRSVDLQTNVDTEFATGDLAGQGGPVLPVKGGFQVAEGFGELSVPLVEHKPFFELLRLEAGYRYSSYTRAGTTDAYKIEGVYKPIKDITVRGGYNRAVRAPNAVELFAPQGQSLFNGTDPCSGLANAAGFVNSATGFAGYNAAQCARTGVTASQFGTGTIDASPAGQYTQLTGGNPDLKPEKSDTYTAGIVLTPRFLPRFSLTVDYFNIKVKNTISALGSQVILNSCVTSGTLCDLIHRDPVTGSIYLNPNGFVTNTNLNIGSIGTKGIDVASSYRIDFSDLGLGLPGGLGFDFVGTYLMSLTTEPGVLGSDNVTKQYDCKGYFGITCGTPNPDWRHTLRVTYTSPAGFSASVRWRYFAPVRLDTLSSNVFLGGAAPSADPVDARLHAVHYIDLAFTVKATDRHSFRFGVNNVFDKDPQVLGTNGLGAYSNGNTYPGVYDTLGRYFFAGFTGNF